MTIPRVREPELMDQPGAETAELWRSLDDLGRVNRWLGGRSTAVRLVSGLARRVPREPVRVLDVGTGGADIPRALSRAASREGWRVRIVATDLHPRTLEFARRVTAGHPDIRVATADVLALPFPDGEFDIAMCCTTLHHFERADALRALRELGRVARWGVVVTDLSRSRAATVGARLLAATVWRRHPITRHDGPVSVRAAFTPAELRELAREAFGGGFRVRAHPGFRLSLVVDRTRR